MLAQIFPVEEKVCEFTEEALTKECGFDIETVSVSMRSDEAFSVTGIVASESSPRTRDLVGASSSIIVPESFGLTDTVGFVGACESKAVETVCSLPESFGLTDTVGFVGACETKAVETVCSSTWKSTSKSKLDQRNEMQKASRRYRRTADSRKVLDSIFLKATRRRRSDLSLRARSSTWGLLGHVKLFKQHADNNVVQNGKKEPRKGRNQARGKRGKRGASQSWKSVKAETQDLMRPIRLKIKLGKDPTQKCMFNTVPVIDFENYGEVGVGNSAKATDGALQEHFSTSSRVHSFNKSLDKSKVPSDASIQDVRNVEACEKSSAKAKNIQGFPSQSHEARGLGETVQSRCLDPGTSPDSEVINMTPETQISGTVSEDVYNIVVCSRSSCAPGVGTSLNPLPASNEEENMRKLLSQEGHHQEVGELPSQHVSFVLLDESTEPLSSSQVTEAGTSSESLKVESTGVVDHGVHVHESSESQIFATLLPNARPKGQNLPKNSRKDVRKSLPKVPGSSKKRENICKLKGIRAQSIGEVKIKEKISDSSAVCGVVNISETEGNCKLDARGDLKEESNCIPSMDSNQHVPTQSAWVCCDDCLKWRRISAILADSIEATNCRWVCKDNMDKDFADCSIPQEKSNAEINAELEISDEEDTRGPRPTSHWSGQNMPTVPLNSSWKLIKTNFFLHRSRKNQTIDEVMVCHCKPPVDGRKGCREGCLNRMLNIECVKGTCPCGELCSNQQFQKRKYAKLKSFHCGKKGYGLQLQEDIPKGRFLIEYVGEVLDMHAYEARQKEYASKGHKHFYFMTLNGSEVIDACAKGNLGRFINHSCEPNCRTEKWMVNGEVCVGLFAIRDIKKGEEVTFDYNYVRVFGAAAKKCVCGSSHCRGYIGGDPVNAEAVVLCDSDEEYPEPIMLDEDKVDKLEDRSSEISLKGSGKLDKLDIVGSLKPSEDKKTPKTSAKVKDQDENSINAIVQPIETSLQSHAVKVDNNFEGSAECSTVEDARISLLNIERTDASSLSSTVSSLSPDTIDMDKKSKSCSDENSRVFLKSNFIMKTKRPSSVKRAKPKSNDVSMPKSLERDKSKIVPFRSKKIMEVSLDGRFEAVQEKLNELLDNAGGISKKKDASRAYLKLLYLTAASGDSGNGGGIQSNRDLSMILDGLLKTKSRMVLVDIVNKNGLQMLHNILKRSRREFNKIPILRKLLKVIEYLAAREILTLEHINRDPPCRGVESFRESILILTEHIDKQVHHIARSFRDKWIPRHLRKIKCMEGDLDQIELDKGANVNKFSSLHNHFPDHDERHSICNHSPENDGRYSMHDHSPDHDKGRSRHSHSPENYAGHSNHNYFPDQERGHSDSKNKCSQQSPATGTHPVVAEGTGDGSSASRGTICVPSDPKRPRKRKSRWDQPADPPKPDGVFPSNPCSSRQSEICKSNGFENTAEDAPPGFSQTQLKKLCKNDLVPGERENLDEDAPPGFVSAVTLDFVQPSNASYTTTAVQPSEVAMGNSQERFISRIPVSYGFPLSILQQFGSSQAEIGDSWGIAPAMPFHPFPPLPLYSRRSPPNVSSSTLNNLTAENKDQTKNFPTTSDSNGPNFGSNNYKNFQRPQGYINRLGSRYFRHKKWNKSSFGAESNDNWGFVQKSNCSNEFGNDRKRPHNSEISDCGNGFANESKRPCNLDIGSNYNGFRNERELPYYSEMSSNGNLGYSNSSYQQHQQ